MRLQLLQCQYITSVGIWKLLDLAEKLIEVFTWIKANYQFAHLVHRLSFKFARTSVSKKRIPRRGRCAAVTVNEETPTEQPGQPRNVSIPNRETILIYQPLAAHRSLSPSFSLFLSLTFSALILFRLVRMLPVPLLPSSLFSFRPTLRPFIPRLLAGTEAG